MPLRTIVTLTIVSLSPYSDDLATAKVFLALQSATLSGWASRFLSVGSSNSNAENSMFVESDQAVGVASFETQAETSSEEGRNRRQHTRHAYRTVTTVLTIPLEGKLGEYRTIKAWTHDISAGGARLITSEELPNSTIYLRMLLPGSGDFYIAAEITHAAKEKPEGLGLRQKERFAYGTKFIDLVRNEDILRELNSVKASGSQNE